ncbi:MAG: leucine-rich repeat domain-containing protein [Paludibacteraceae bacterium]|nr:leucine-rich repeat domain-containing protein [Paludibacteraceae bacterium]
MESDKKITIIDNTLIINDGVTVINKDDIGFLNGIYSLNDSIQKIVFPSSLQTIGERTFSYFYNLEEIQIPEGVTCIEESSFRNCNNLKSVKFPNSLRIIKSSAFENCINLSSIEFPDSLEVIGDEAFRKTGIREILGNMNNVSSIGFNAFYGCSNLGGLLYYANGTRCYGWIGPVDYCPKSIDILQSVIDIDNFAFKNCQKLEVINLPDNLQSIGRHAFENTGIKSIRFPRNLNQIEHDAFRRCSQLSEIDFPNSIKSIEFNTFEGCCQLKKITFPSSLESIGSQTFAQCSALEEITIPNAVTSIGNDAFADCSNLKKVTLPDSLEQIQNCTFYDCQQLHSINVPNALTYIGEDAFHNCKNLSKLKVGENVIVESTAYSSDTWDGLRTLGFLFLLYIVIPIVIICILHIFFPWGKSILFFFLGLALILAILLGIFCMIYKGHGA